MDDNNVLIICIAAIVCILMISGTFIFMNFHNDVNILNVFDNGENTGTNNSNSNEKVQVNSVTFYSDGNPNTGETATINVGKEHSGKQMEVLTYYYRDNKKFNSQAVFNTVTVDVDGNIVTTDYTPMNKYPDFCHIEIMYDGNIYKYECDIAKHKGTQTAIPRQI